MKKFVVYTRPVNPGDEGSDHFVMSAVTTEQEIKQDVAARNACNNDKTLVYDYVDFDAWMVWYPDFVERDREYSPLVA